MKIIPCFSLFFCLSFQTLNAQPGGGGGIQIMKVIVPDPAWNSYKTISKKDSSLKINAYYLTLTKNKEISSITRNTTLNNYDRYDFADKVFTHIYLPPHYYKAGEMIPASNQRLELIYKGDTMTLDFFDILSENGSGRTDKIDTITFYPGKHYLQCFRNVNDKISRFYPGNSASTTIRASEMDSIRRCMQMGITNHALPLLYKYELVQELRKPIMTIFFREGNYDTLWLRSYPIYTLDLKNISIRSNRINIKTAEAPVFANNELNYKFYLDYIPAFLISQQKEGQEKASLLLRQLKTTPLEINGRPFTGTIKWLFPFSNAWPRYNGTSLCIHTFNKGLLIKEEIRYDVDPILEWEMIRPTSH